MIKLKDILLEMGSMTIAPVLDLYDQNPEKVSSVLFPGQKTKSRQEVEDELASLGYNDFSQFRDELGIEIEEAERTKAGRKVNKAYLTKNKSAMKKEIDRVAKLSNDDPSAYTKWDADYADKDKKKPYKTKKSAATSAYEKRFGKNESINEGDADTALANKAKATGISKSVLRGVYDKGLAAWKTGHRPGVGQHQWAMARVNSFVTGKGGARKADKGLWKKASKSKKKKSSVEELSLKKILGTTALATGLAMSPNQAKAQEPTKAPTTQVQKQDTTIGFGLGKSSQEHTARTMARLNATKDLMQKLGKTELSSGIEIVDSKTFQTKNGYEVEMKVKISQ
jgi:hypothetical protein